MEYGVFARRKIARREKVQGLDGYFAPAVEGAPTFSIFGSEKGVEKILLGPASFVNHSCEPNAIFACGGPTKSNTILRIETLREIKEGEEFFVKYGMGYFGVNNTECRCNPCMEELFRPPVPTSQASSSTSTLLPSTSISLPISSSTSVVSAVSSPPLLIQTVMPLSPSSSSVPSSVLSSDFSPQKQSISQRPVPCSPAAVSIANSDKQGKKTKYDEVTQCLICEKTAKRFDRHLQSCHPELTSEDCQI